MKFDMAVSIGTNCQSRYHISRQLYLRQHGTCEGFVLGGHKNTCNDYGTHFFDWCVARIEGVIQVLKSDFDQVLLLENLEIIPLSKANNTVRDRHTGICYPHLFPFELKGERKEQINDQALSAHYVKEKEKYEYLVMKTRRLFTDPGNILFVLCGAVSDAHLEELIAVIEGRKSDFAILYVEWLNGKHAKLGEHLRKHPRILYRQVVNDPYPGNKPGWERVFEGIELALPKPREMR